MIQAKQTQPDSWSAFDKIYCISIDERKDRRERAREQFARVGLLERTEFVIVGKHAENQEKGIFESHMLCLKKGLNAGAGNILVFEDDIIFKRFTPSTLSESCACLNNQTTWNGYFLGCISNGSKKTEVKSLVAIKYRCLAHAYVLNRPFASRLVRHEWSGIPFDSFLRRHNKGFFALYPMCAFQGYSATDNQTVVIDRIRRLLGGLPFIQRANELYQNHKLPLLFTNLALLFILCVLVLKN